MFSSGLKAIYKKIEAIKDKEKQNEAYNYLESKLLNNPYIKHQFDLLQSIKANTNKITTQESFDSFVKGIKEKNKTFIKENKDVSPLKIWKENKSLFEYFNINHKEIPFDKYDAAIDIYATGKSMNEALVKQLVKKKLSESLLRTKELLTEEKFLLTEDNIDLSLDRQFQIINFLTECMPTQNATKKTFIKESLYASIKFEPFKRKEIQNKLQLLLEAELGKGNAFPIPGCKYIHPVGSLSIEGNRIRLTFFVPIYPIGAGRSILMYYLINVNKKLKAGRLQRVFVNSTIYQRNKTQYFNPADETSFTAGIRKQISTEDLKAQLKANHRFEQLARFNFYTTINSDLLSLDAKSLRKVLETQAADMLKGFDSALPSILEEYAESLTADAQKEEFEATKELTPNEILQKAKNAGSYDSKVTNKGNKSNQKKPQGNKDGVYGYFGDYSKKLDKTIPKVEPDELDYVPVGSPKGGSKKDF